MKLTLRQIRVVILLLTFSLFFIGLGYSLGQRDFEVRLSGLKPEVSLDRRLPPSKEKVSFSLFWQVWDRLTANYLGRKNLDQAKMIYGAISGMVASLGDPYTVFLPPEENKQTKEDLSGLFEGVGIQLGYKNERLAVIAPLTGMPADLAGVKAGDYIVKVVDEAKKIDKDTTGLSLPEAVSLIRGPKGTIVKLTFERDGVKEPFTYSLKRETIVVKSVELKFIEKSGKKIADLKLTRFGERTAQEWEAAVEDLKNESKKGQLAGVILDLRNNPGGFLNGSVFIASEFLSSGVVVQQDKGADGKETFSVNRTGTLLNEPLVVLINQGSASASEIVAGTLQERKRARLVGEKSFGKGTIQEAQDLSEGAGLHITIARWLLPSGKSIDKEGIKPDFEVIRQPAEDEKDQTSDPQMEKAIELLTK